jgi:HEAT repeat protein
VELKKAALYAIEDFEDKESANILYEVALASDSEELAKAAVYALEDRIEDMEGGDPSMLLEIYKKSKFDSVRKTALHSIEDIEGPAAIEMFAAILKTEENPDIKRTIIHALGDTESDVAVPILEDIALNDKNVKLRADAVSALGEIGTPKAREALMKVLEKKD